MLVCRYQSTDPRYAALKAASKGVEQILLRQTNTRMIYEYKGRVVQLDTPKEITRGDPPRTIVYSKKPSVQFVRKFVFMGADEADQKDEEAVAAEEPKKKRAKKPKAAATDAEPVEPAP